MSRDSMMGTKIKPLYEKLFDIQQAMPAMVKDKSNPGFKGAKYYNFDSLMEKLKPLLAESKIFISFEFRPDETPSNKMVVNKDRSGAMVVNGGYVHAAVVFVCAESGDERHSGFISIPIREHQMHSGGGSLTYIKTKLVAAALAIVTGEDNDGADDALKHSSGSHETDDMMGG